MSTTLSNPARPLDYATDARPSHRIVGTSTSFHRLALLTAVATFPLIFMGGLVTSHHAGMSVPDWPNSYGYNMFLFPPSHWVGGILYEHTHRLMATVVGMLSIALVVWGWRAQLVAAGIWCLQRPWIARLIEPLKAARIKYHPPIEPHRWLALAVLAAVIFQGVLGGLRVVLVKLDLAIVHACFAQAFFCLAAYAALVTSQWWQTAPTLADGGGRSLVTLGITTVALVYLQLIVGATMRHFDAGLAIPDLPLAYGKVLPPTTAEGLAAVNHYRAFQLNLDPVTMTQLWLHFAHRMGAVLVIAATVAFAAAALRRCNVSGLKTPACVLLLLLATQVTLGVLTVLLRKPADVASAHVAVGALVLMTSFMLTCRAVRVYRTGATERVGTAHEGTTIAARMATA